MKFKHTVFIDAEQYLPEENKIPEGAFLDGRNNKRALSDAEYMIRTADGAQYITPGDYITKVSDDLYRIMRKEDFEKVWKPV